MGEVRGGKGQGGFCHKGVKDNLAFSQISQQKQILFFF